MLIEMSRGLRVRIAIAVSLGTIHMNSVKRIRMADFTYMQTRATHLGNDPLPMTQYLASASTFYMYQSTDFFLFVIVAAS